MTELLEKLLKLYKLTDNEVVESLSLPPKTWYNWRKGLRIPPDWQVYLIVSKLAMNEIMKDGRGLSKHTKKYIRASRLIDRYIMSKYIKERNTANEGFQTSSN